MRLSRLIGSAWTCPRRPRSRWSIRILIEAPAFIGRTLQAISDREWARRQRLGGFNAGAHGLGPRFDRETEPELFYHENGEPTIQENVTKPEVLRRVIEYWRARLEENPGMRAISVGPHDFDPIMGRPARRLVTSCIVRLTLGH